LLLGGQLETFLFKDLLDQLLFMRYHEAYQGLHFFDVLQLAEEVLMDRFEDA
jgi:hypothetical protein